MRELTATWTNRHLLSSLARQDLRRVQAGTAAGSHATPHRQAITFGTMAAGFVLVGAAVFRGLRPQFRECL